MRVSAPAEKLLLTTSTLGTSSQINSLPRSVVRSRVSDFLPVLASLKRSGRSGWYWPRTGWLRSGSMRRPDSTLITSAPKLARMRVPKGPAATQQKSSTRMPSRGIWGIAPFAWAPFAWAPFERSAVGRRDGGRGRGGGIGGVLPELRGRPDGQRRLHGVERAAAEAERPADGGGVDVVELTRLAEVLRLHHLGEVHRGHGGVAAVPEPLQELVARDPGGQLDGEVLQRILQAKPGGPAALVDDLPVVGREAVLDAGGVEQGQEGVEPVARDVAGDPATVAALQRLTEAGADGDLAPPQPGVGVARLHQLERGGLLHRDVELGAGAAGGVVAAVQRDHGRAGDGEPGHRVGREGGTVRGGIGGVAGDMQQAARGGRGEVGGLPVAAGARLAVGRGRHVDQLRVERAQIGEAEAQAVHLAGRARLDQHVGGGGEGAQLGDALRRRQVDDARLLVGVEVKVLVGAVGPRPAVDEGREPARARAVGRLDQRDLGPEVGEQASAQGGALVGQVEDANAGEGQEGRIVGGRRHRATPHRMVVGDAWEGRLGTRQRQCQRGRRTRYR